MADENKLNKILEEQEKLSSVEYLIQKINGSGIKLNLNKEQMKEILEAGKEVQKMAVKYGTNQYIQIDDENTFNGYGTYVVSVNEDNARQLGIKIASRKYGGTFYINNQPFLDFLQEKSFSPYWSNLVSEFKDNSVDKLSHSILTSDVKGNPSLEREQIALSTLLNLDLIEYKREQTFLYSVNIPDNDNTNYLLYNNPIGIEHAQKINEHLEKLGTSWRVSRNDIGKNIYFNVLSNNVFNGNQKKSSEFLKNLGYVGMQMDNANYIVFNDKDMSITDRVQFMKDVNGEVYGFAYQGQIYADEELVNSNVLVHEYTHLWDKYVQDNNPELWQHGKDILKGTSLWQEITEDKNYENLKTDDEILSECHARVVGKMAAQILEKIEREDGGLTRDRVIDWDKEVSQYIAEELNINPELGNENYNSENAKAEYLKEFLSMPMKDLMNEVQIEREKKTLDIVIEPYSRKPEDIKAIKGFVSKVTGVTIENITNQQAQAFIDNLGITEEAYLTAKTDGTFEYTNNNPYSPDIYKTSEPKEILSIIEDYANDHLEGYNQESEQAKDYDFIHSVNENYNEKEISVFDKELEDYSNGKLDKNHIFNLGTPEEILQKCGFPKDQRIELSGSHLDFKSKLNRHPFELREIKGLDKALQNPVAVFAYGDKRQSQNVVVNIEQAGKNYLAGVHFNQNKRGFEVSDIRTLFPKENHEWLNWINQGKLIYGDKEKLQALIAQQRMNVAEVNIQVVQSPLYEHCLESANNILQKFGDVKDIYTDGVEWYSEIKEQSDIEQKFYGYYTEKNNLDARELSHIEAQEFYNALKTNDLDKIKEYTEHEELHEVSKLAKNIYDEKTGKQNSIEQELDNAKKTIQEQNKKIKEQDELLNGKGSVKVNGVERKFELGLKHAFPEAVKRIDIENQRNKDLTAAYNELAKSKLNDISPISPSDDGNTY